ncbi:5980_t:CDS:10 [Entrophospora sp. SA101]|nr:5980_t:CDS:10 [Entrophospora sp. SA101]
MGKKNKKGGKGRLDKYYHLAKEHGYRARSAFKLIQLNKKYNFLEKSKCLIDLCAAPGGWLQVASKYMPMSSLIVGVDLVPIKPIPKIITLQEDITSEKCRSALRNQLKTWKADVVLHDGAPNVGISWIQDAYSQSELTLKALKLAVEFLTKGGIFITKIFRSKDYNNLLWVFNQLFNKVEATKPASSRNVSAEIYVICKDFIAPKKIDPKFLDPKSKRQREGYEEGDYTLYKEISVLEFINTDDPVKLLGSVNKLKFDDDKIKLSCEDLKVLGRKEFKNLIKWKNNMEKLREEKTKIEKVEENDQEQESMDEDELIQEELEKLTKEELARKKKLRRKTNEKRQKNTIKMQLKMITPVDIALEDSINGGDDSLFDLKLINKTGSSENIEKNGTVKSNGKSLKRKAAEIQDDDNDEDIEIVPVDKDSDEEMWDANIPDEDEKKMKRAQKIGLITAEAITLAQQLVNGKKTKEDLIDDGFRRYVYNDKEGLPLWFADDEKKHNKPNLPITKEAVNVIRERMKALNARPIKKIAEAKARKKIRIVKKLKKLQKKTDAIADTSDMTEKEKANTISKMVGKVQKKTKKDIKLVVAKGSARGIKGRPKGIKGRYRMVDAPATIWRSQKISEIEMLT